MIVCSTVSRRDLPRVRVLAASYAAHHPGERLHVLVTDDVDATVDERAEPFELCRPRDLRLSRRDFDRMAAIYDAKELVTSIKFWQIELLLDRDDVVLFLDSDVVVYRSLADLGARTAAAGVVVTPHSVEPIPLDGKTPTELQIQRSGVYNTGFFGFARSGRAFLEWVQERLRRDSIVEPREGLWFDQRWFDFAPLLFGAEIARDRAFNVAYWNLHERELAERDGRVLVDGDPLSFFHFSGFDPHNPDRLTRVASRIVPREGSTLHRLCRAYAAALLVAGYDEYSDVAYGLDRAGDVKWTIATRRVYRAALKAAEAGRAAFPPEPSQPSFAGWLRDAASHGAVPIRDRTALLLEASAASDDAGRPLVRFARHALSPLLRPALERERALGVAALDAAGRVELELRREIDELEARIAILERQQQRDHEDGVP